MVILFGSGRRPLSPNLQALAALVLLLLLPTACLPGPEAPSRELVVLMKGWPLAMVPHLQAERVTYSVQVNIFEALAEFDSEMRIRPLLAESWGNPDENTWLLRLRKDVRFHDGSPMTATDVIYSLNRARNHPRSALQANFVMVREIRQEDDHTIRIVTTRPYPILLNRLVNAYIVPRRMLERQGDEAFARAPVGTGPYRFQSFPEEGPITLTAWDEYWGSPPAFRTLRIHNQLDQARTFQLLTEGRAAIVPQLTTGLAGALKRWARGSFRVHQRPGLMLRFLGFDFRIGTFRDLRIRRAISLAVDRRRLIQENLQGFGQPANQLVPRGVFGFHPGLPDLAYDPPGARALLAKAGYPDGLDLELTVPQVRQHVGLQLQRQMAPAGIRLALKVLPREAFIAQVRQAPFYLLGEASTSGDASDVLADAIHSPTNGYGMSNWAGYHNPLVDQLVEKSGASLHQQQRLQALQAAMAAAMADLPRIPLYIEDEIYGISDRVRWRPRLDILFFGKEVLPAED